MRVELLCLDVDGTLTDGSLIYGFGNSSLGASCVDFGNLGRFADFHPVSHPKFPKNSTTSTAIRRICERSEATNTRIFDLKNAESATFCHSERSEESKKNPSLRADSQNLRGNPPYKFNNIDCHESLRDEGFAGKTRNDENLDSSLRKCSARNDNVGLDSSLRLRSAQNDKNSARVAESRLDSALSTQEANSAIADEFLGFCETSDEDRTLVHRGSELKQSLKSRCESEFAEILKVFNAKDGLALAYWAKSLNRKVAIITGKKSEILRHRARELGINLLFMGVSDKGKIVRDLKKDLGLDSTQIAAIGDDLNDISMFAESSLNFAPRDCASHLKTLPNIEILRCKGGRGAVREAIETILQKEGIYEDFISVFAR